MWCSLQVVNCLFNWSFICYRLLRWPMKMPKMKQGKTVKNWKWHFRQKCRKQISVLVKNVKNYFLSNFFQKRLFKLKLLINLFIYLKFYLLIYKSCLFNVLKRFKCDNVVWDSEIRTKAIHMMYTKLFYKKIKSLLSFDNF